MAGTITITQDTIVKILVRRGTNSERQLTTLTEGEIGYTIDTQRLFIGDGITLGGVPIGNRFLGSIGSRTTYNSIAQNGDTIYQTGGGSQANTLFANTGNNDWIDIHPQPYIDNLEKSTNGEWRVASRFIGGDSDELIPSGLTVAYNDTSYTPQSITGLYNRLDFDARFLSVSGDTITPTHLNTSFYFGDINSKKVKNNLNAMVNIDNSLYINGRQSTGNPFQIQMYATDPLDSNASSIRSQVSGLNVGGQNRVSLLIKNGAGNSMEGYRLSLNGSTLNTTFSSSSDGSYGNPNFTFKGVSRFDDSVTFNTNANVTMLGNLSVYGDISYFETIVSTTSSLSVVNNNPNVDALVVAQLNYGGGSVYPQNIARFMEGAYNTPVLILKENQFAGFNVDPAMSYETNNANFVVSGSILMVPHANFGGDFNVFHRNIQFNSNGDMRLACRNSGNFYLTAGATGYLQVEGGIQATGDVVAYYSSDIKLKDNIAVIPSPLEKLNKISGVSFDWKDNSPYTGHDVGVLAQEIEAIIPEAVITRKNGTKAVRYEKIIPLLIEAVKELNNKQK